MGLHVHFADGSRPGHRRPAEETPLDEGQSENSWVVQIFNPSNAPAPANSPPPVTAPSNSPTEEHSPNHHPEPEQQPRTPPSNKTPERPRTFRDLFCRRRSSAERAATRGLSTSPTRPPRAINHSNTALPRPSQPIPIPGRSPTHPFTGENQVLHWTCLSDGLPPGMRPRQFADGTVDYGRKEIWMPWQIDPRVDQWEFMMDGKLREANEKAMKRNRVVLAREEGWI